MDPITVLPETNIETEGPVSELFHFFGIKTFQDAARYVKNLPYGFNEDSADILAVLRDRFGTCTTKHAVIAALAVELHIPVFKTLGMYAMDNMVMDGIRDILTKWKLPFVPALHCFLTYGDYTVDLTEGNCTGKKCSIDTFLFKQIIPPLQSAEEEQEIFSIWCEKLSVPGGPLSVSGKSSGDLHRALEECIKILKTNQVCSHSRISV